MKYLLLLLIPLVTGGPCSGPYVDADSAHTSSDYCIVNDNKTNYVSLCPSTTSQCDKDDGMCYEYTRYDTDPCEQNSQCPLNNCNSNGLCEANKLNEECDEHRECAVGLFCDIQSNRTCQTQRKEGDVCGDMFYCENHLTCDRATKKCVQLFSQAEGADCDDVYGLGEQWSWQCDSAYCNKQSKCQSTNLPSNLQQKCSQNSDCKLSSGDEGTCECAFTQKGESYCSTQPGDNLWTDVVADVKQLLFPFLKKTTGICHTLTRFIQNCWIRIEPGTFSFGIFFLEKSQAFNINGASWSELSPNTLSALFPFEEAADSILHFKDQCSSYNCSSHVAQPQCISFNQNTYWISDQECGKEFYCPMQQNQQNQQCTVGQVSFEWQMPGEYCYDTNQCYKKTKCVDHFCKGLEQDQPCSGSTDFTCDVGFACIFTAQNNYTCQKQLEQSQTCQNDYQCVNDAMCVGGVCRNLLSVNVGEEITGSCYFMESGILINEVCKSLQCIDLNQTHMKCIEGFKTDTNTPKESTYLKECASATSDFVEYTSVNCSFSTNAKSYCGAHLGDEKGVLMIEALEKIQGKSQGKCHTTKRYDAECWFNRINANWNEFRNYFSLKQQFIFYPQLDLADKCTQYVYFNEYYNMNYNAAATYEEGQENAFLLGLIGSLITLLL